MKVFILAAGLGTRLRSITQNKPKAMVKIGGKPVLEHLILLCKHHGFIDIIINLHYLPEVITNYFKNGAKFGVKISYSDEAKQIMGGAGALKQAEKLLGREPFFVLSGDVLTNINLKEMAEYHRKKKSIGTFLVRLSDHPYDSDLVEMDQSMRITRFFRSNQGDNFKPVSKSGTHLFEPLVLDLIPNNKPYSLEKQLIPDLLKKGFPLYGFMSKAYSKDIGAPERLAQANQDYEAGNVAF